MLIEFYTGPHCGLCNDAKALITEHKSLYPAIEIDIDMRNIRENTEWYHLYAVRIPVLKRSDTGDELGWPFDLNDLHALLS